MISVTNRLARATAGPTADRICGARYRKDIASLGASGRHVSLGTVGAPLPADTGPVARESRDRERIATEVLYGSDFGRFALVSASLFITQPQAQLACHVTVTVLQVQ